MNSNRHELRFGVVVIGRNEGERLRRCLESVTGAADRVAYVDSGSSDGSVAMARSRGVDVVELDMAMPFTAARARNSGFARLIGQFPDLEFVQFVDGDCEVVGGWLAAASGFLAGTPEAAAVCGRLRERNPERSVYNMLCDIEWDGPVGEIKACGGNAMMRVEAFRSIEGFRADLIAGEEPELCVRLRAAGWKVWRIGRDMALHDAAMTRFGQWWRRTLRSGHSYAQASHLHGAPPERHGIRETRSAWFWGLGLPLLVAALSAWLGLVSLLLLLAYPLQVVRLARRGGRSRRENWWHAFFLVAGKFPEMLGQLKFHYHRCLGGRAGLIEHRR